MASTRSTSRAHLEEAGMGYGAHFGRAARIGGTLIGAGAACLVHAVVPSLFTTKATRTIIRLNEEVAKGPSHAPAGHWIEFEI